MDKTSPAAVHCIVVSVNFGDFLGHTLPHNLDLVDRITVVTHKSDEITQKVCRANPRADCLVTDRMYSENSVFNKGQAINHAFELLREGSWVLLLDADIILPAGFKNMAFNAVLDETKLYGADRLNVYGFDKYLSHAADFKSEPPRGYILNPPKGLEVASRFIHWRHGYVPVGYFQLFFYSGERKYPANHGTAGDSDVEFAALWPRENRVLLPDFYVYQLESENGPIPLGTNWNGRKTKSFGPPEPE